MSAIGNNIRILRENLDLTQEQVASVIGISREYLSYMEKGTRPVPAKYLDSFADLLDIDVEQLLDQNTAGVKVITSFRSLDSTDQDMKQIAAFRRIVRNYLKIKMLADEQR